MDPAVAELINSGYSIRKVDVRHNYELAEQYRVRVIPTFVVIENGRELRRVTGSISENSLRNLF